MSHKTQCYSTGVVCFDQLKLSQNVWALTYMLVPALCLCKTKTVIHWVHWSSQTVLTVGCCSIYLIKPSLHLFCHHMRLFITFLINGLHENKITSKSNNYSWVKTVFVNLWSFFFYQSVSKSSQNPWWLLVIVVFSPTAFWIYISQFPPDEVVGLSLKTKLVLYLSD